MAQFGRALRSGRRGRKFESCRLDFLYFTENAGIAQQVEHFTRNEGVVSSNLISSLMGKNPWNKSPGSFLCCFSWPQPRRRFSAERNRRILLLRMPARPMLLPRKYSLKICYLPKPTECPPSEKGYKSRLTKNEIYVIIKSERETGDGLLPHDA